MTSSTDSRDGRAELDFSPERVLGDYRVAYRSRQASLLGRREVLTGKAKFGIFGDGKEAAQMAMAGVFRPGDFRAGYYRDQTFMMAQGLLSVRELFAQLYADADPEREPSSGGRQMVAHFSTRMLEPDGTYRSLVELANSSADISPTAGQMPRLVGLAYASKLYREIPELAEGFEHLSRKGQEVAFGTIGNASSAEGLFWEAVNAVGVLEAPMLLSIWDDGYGISVSNEHQLTKGDVGALLQGFQREPGSARGYDVYSVKGWDYQALCATYAQAAEGVRSESVPAIVHVTELTQPQGHSTSGSHERYKSKERLEWELEHCCIKKMREWILDQELANEETLNALEKEEDRLVKEEKQAAWKGFRDPIEAEKKTVLALIEEVADGAPEKHEPRRLKQLAKGLSQRPLIHRRDLMSAAFETLLTTADKEPADAEPRERLQRWWHDQRDKNRQLYGEYLLAPEARSPLQVKGVDPVYDEGSPQVRGFEVLNQFFDQALERYPNLVAFGEDVGQLGDVNQGFAGLQAKYGELRVSDTGIRECSILGQAIGLAMRGLRPIAEIQYLDYVLYALQIMSDDLATLRWRSMGGQKAPVIVRTRGHRLEGIWHAGSPMGGIVHLLRGMHVCVPRDMTRAAGFYNTLLQGDDPALVVEVLNGYRMREPLPRNLAELALPLGAPEILREGGDVTLVTYGACCRVVLQGAELLARRGIEAEVVDVQTLLPFDLHGTIAESLKKTHRLVIVDEDVPGGASSYMMQQILEEQDGFWWLDAPPRSLTATAHRPPYGSDGDYFTKPNPEDVFQTVYELLHHDDSKRYPIFYR